jgi:hypothetical protein
MPTSTALALIIASDVPTIFCYLYTSRLVIGISTEIVTGVTHGIPIPTTWRWKMIDKWLYVVAAGVAACAIAATVNVKIATAATDEGVKTVAYLVAFFGALIALSWLLHAVSDFIYLRSVLREANRD